jgi:hypothetical protein
MLLLPFLVLLSPPPQESSPRVEDVPRLAKGVPSVRPAEDQRLLDLYDKADFESRMGGLAMPAAYPGGPLDPTFERSQARIAARFGRIRKILGARFGEAVLEGIEADNADTLGGVWFTDSARAAADARKRHVALLRDLERRLARRTTE